MAKYKRYEEKPKHRSGLAQAARQRGGAGAHQNRSEKRKGTKKQQKERWLEEYT